MDNRDFRVRAYLYFTKELQALGLYDHTQDVIDEAVDINTESPNAEMRLLEVGDSWIVEFDLAFPPDKQGIARGLFNHSKNTPAVKLPNPTEGQDTGSVSIERCGHRIKQGCEPIERYEVA